MKFQGLYSCLVTSFLLCTLCPCLLTSLAAAEAEPNNTRAQADPMVLNSSNQASESGSISPLSDLDFYAITTPAFSGQGSLVITMTPASTDRRLDAWIQLQSANGTLLAERDLGFDNDIETLTYSSANPNTTYYILCRSADFSDAGSGQYTVHVRVVLPAPNLAPYQPANWSDEIVVSKTHGTTEDSTALTATNVLYVDWAVANSGNSPVVTPFVTALYIDGVLRTNWSYGNVPLNAGFFFSLQDYAIGPLSIGNHSISLVVDATQVVDESVEGDNVFTKTIEIVDDDLNDQINGAHTLGTVNSTLTMPGGIDAATDVDIFAVIVSANQRVSFDIDETSGLDTHLRIFDSNGTELASNNNATGPGETAGNDSFIEHTFQTGGTFFVGISSSNNKNYNPTTGVGDVAGSSGSYTLVVSPGLAGTIQKPLNPNKYQVDIIAHGSIPQAISTNQRTWIVIHGWNSSRTNENIAAITQALYETRAGDQVLTLDWSAAADALTPFLAEDAILPVAEWAASALVGYGLSGTNINLVGHSFGSYVSDEIAERIPGGVNTIVTLDPAADVLGGYDSDGNGVVDFAAHSFFSWSFHSSSFSGNEFTPTTADESFVVESGADPISAHSHVVFMFAHMLLNPTDPVSQFFLITRLLSGGLGPWVPDQYFALDGITLGYEAKISTADNGKTPVNLEFVRLPTLTVSKTGNNVSISWAAFYSDFILQSSSTGGPPAMWVNVPVQPTLVGQIYVVSLPASESKMLFRLVRQ